MLRSRKGRVHLLKQVRLSKATAGYRTPRRKPEIVAAFAAAFEAFLYQRVEGTLTMNRREVVGLSLAGVAGAIVGSAQAPVAGAAGPKPDKSGSMIVVLAELRFPAGTTERAAEALSMLQEATRVEPGCLRYQIARDIDDEGVFHLSEIWQDIGALSAHFATPHMAAFSATAHELGYSAPFMRQVVVESLSELRPRELRLLVPAPAPSLPNSERK